MRADEYPIFCGSCGEQVTKRCVLCLTSRCDCLERCVGCGAKKEKDDADKET